MSGPQGSRGQVLSPVRAFASQAGRPEIVDRPAVICGASSLSYRELSRYARAVAAWIRSGALRPDARVGVLGGRGLETIGGILGCCWAGVTYVPLSARQPAAHLSGLLDRADLDALLVDEAGAALVASGDLVGVPPRVLDLTEDIADSDAPSDPTPYEADDLAYLMFTSGTTGTPKGVMVTASNVDHFVRAMHARFDIGPGDRCSQFFEFTFDLSVFDLFVVLGTGATLYVVSDLDRMAPVRFIRKHELSVWFSVPSAAALARRTRQLAPDALESVRLSLFCGEPLPAALAEAWGEAAPGGPVENLYGPTEATVACLAERCDAPGGRPIKATPDRGSVTIGTPFADMTAAVVDESGRFLEDGSVGELAVSGPLLAAGYWRDPEQTAARYPTLEHPVLGARRWYLTGDLAYRDEDGDFHHLGRADNQVKVLGHRIELEGLDAHLRAVCGTDSALVVAWPVVDGSAQGLVAFVSDCTLSVDHIRTGLKERLPSSMVPGRVVILDELPLTANGKLDRKAMHGWLEDERNPQPAGRSCA